MVNLSVANIFGWDTVKLVQFIRVKVQFGQWISKDGLINNFFCMREGRKFVVGEM